MSDWIPVLQLLIAVVGGYLAIYMIIFGIDVLTCNDFYSRHPSIKTIAVNDKNEWVSHD